MKSSRIERLNEELECYHLLELIYHEQKNLALAFSCELCEFFKNTFFTEHLWETGSVRTIEIVKILISNTMNRYIRHSRKYKFKFLLPFS